MSKVCLVIIYNHKFEKNIEVLNRIYRGRFSGVYHVMPFYEGSDSHVIGVYESSYQFNGYVAQAASRFMSDEFTHYFFVADDMVIDPSITECNILDALKMGDTDAFTTRYNLIDNKEIMKWGPAIPSVVNLLNQANACEWTQYLPTIEKARECFEAHGIDWQKGVNERYYSVFKKCCMVVEGASYYYKLYWMLRPFLRHLSFSSGGDRIYPMVRGYSDVFMVPALAMKEFVRYMGVFAACRVYVEVAIPTSLVFACKKIQTLKGTGLTAVEGNAGVEFRDAMEKSYGLDYGNLVQKFPKNQLFIHPVKLSRWRNLP